MIKFATRAAAPPAPSSGTVRLYADADGAMQVQDSAGDLTPLGGGSASAAWPVGSIFLSMVETNPATLLGFGTWAEFGAGRMLIGKDSEDSDFDTLGEEGGAKSSSAVVNHTHQINITDPGHTHTQTTSATDGASGRADASSGGTTYTNVGGINSSTTGITATSDNPASGVSSFSLMNPYIVVRMWERTA